MNEQSLEGRRVLIVEDDPLIALDLKTILEDVEVVVLGPASCVADAITLAEDTAFDAAILDVRLELGTTLPFADWLAERAVPFLFQTSDPSVIGISHPAAPVLRKPFRPDQLIQALTALLAKMP